MSTTERKRKVFLLPGEYGRIQQRLHAGTASSRLHHRSFEDGETGLVQTTRFFDVLSALAGNAVPHAFFVYGDELIKDFTYGDIAKIIEPVRQNFQNELNLGRLLTRKADDKQKVELKRAAADALIPTQTLQNAPFFSENARAHILSWKEELELGKSLGIVENSLALFIENMERSVLGRTLDEELRADFSWLFLEGIFSVIIPDSILKIQAALTGNGRRAQRVLQRIGQIIDERFAQYVLSGGKKVLLLDEYIEHYLRTEIVREPEQSKQEVKLRELLEDWKAVLKTGGASQRKKLFTQLNRALRMTTREAVATMSASFETTASVFEFCIIMAATDKEMYARVVREAQSYQGDISACTFSQMLREFPEIYGLAAATLEKFPPLGLQFREAGKSGVIMVHGKEYTVRKGDLLFYDLATTANKRPLDQQKHADEIRAHASAKRSDTQLANQATAHVGFEHRGPQNCIGKFTAIEQLMRAVYELAKHIPDFELDYPDGVDPTIPKYGATNSAQHTVRMRVGKNN